MGSEYDSQVQKHPHCPPPSPRPQIEKVEQPKVGLPPMAVPMDHPKSYNTQSCDYQSSDPKTYRSAAQIPGSAPPSGTATNDRQPVTVTSPVLTVDHDALNHQAATPSHLSPSCDRALGKRFSYDIAPAHSSKRQYADSFGSGHQEQPLHHGKRPDTPPEQDSGPSSPEPQLPGVSDESAASDGMFYTRADGRRVTVAEGLSP
jgi:hypothetical protein